MDLVNTTIAAKNLSCFANGQKELISCVITTDHGADQLLERVSLVNLSLNSTCKVLGNANAVTVKCSPFVER